MTDIQREKASGQIRKLRETIGMTQKEFGEKLGLTRDKINFIEHGKTKVTPELITHICSKLSVNELWLTDGTGEMKNTNHNFLTGKLLAEITKENDPLIIELFTKILAMDDSKRQIFFDVAEQITK